MAKTRGESLTNLATILSDYRQGEITARSPDLIDAWLKQFPAQIQEPLLEGLIHVFGTTYISKAAFNAFLSSLASSNKFSTTLNPQEYWRTVRFLDIQQGGSSQKDILGMFDNILRATHGFGIADADGTNGDFIYLDDCVGTGSRVRSDICKWLETDAPHTSTIHVITPVLYQGSWWIDDRIRDTAAANGKTVTLQKWRLNHFDLENRRARRNIADVLWPTQVPIDADVQAYANQLQSLGHPFECRAPGNKGSSPIFADDTQKQLIEQAMLVRGCQIRRECGSLPDRARPLGYQTLDSFGFGSMVVTYRNCPNNCPLALWVQQAEFPALLPRKTNTQTAGEQLMKELFG